jgi:hypothetical protein
MESFHRHDIGRFFKPALNPVEPLIVNPGEMLGQFQPQQQQQQQMGGGNPEDFLRQLSIGNMSGLQMSPGF